MIRKTEHKYENQYYFQAKNVFDVVFFIRPKLVTYHFNPKKNSIDIFHNGLKLNNISMLHVNSFPKGSKAETLFLIKVLASQGCPIINQIKDEIGKRQDLFDLFSMQDGISCFVISSIEAGEILLKSLPNAQYPLVSKPVFGQQGRGISKLDNLSNALTYCRQHFLQSKEALILEEFMNYTREWRVYVVDGNILFTYERVKKFDRLVSNLSKGSQPVSTCNFYKPKISDFVKSRIPNKYKLGIYGVDIALTAENTFNILEINSRPGWKGARMLNFNFPYEAYKTLIKRAR